jgi:hypothetical protein
MDAKVEQLTGGYNGPIPVAEGLWFTLGDFKDRDFCKEKGAKLAVIRSPSQTARNGPSYTDAFSLRLNVQDSAQKCLTSKFELLRGDFTHV